VNNIPDIFPREQTQVRVGESSRGENERNSRLWRPWQAVRSYRRHLRAAICKRLCAARNRKIAL